MQPLTPTTVYIPVTLEEGAKADGYVLATFNYHEQVIQPLLPKPNHYVLSKEELIELLKPSEEYIRQIVANVAHSVKEKGYGGCSVAWHYAKNWMEENKSLLNSIYEKETQIIDNQLLNNK